MIQNCLFVVCHPCIARSYRAWLPLLSQTTQTRLQNPPDIAGQEQPCLIFDAWYVASRPRPTFSVIVNIFNHGFSIRRVLTQLLKLTAEPFELILFFDGCTDNSLDESLAVLQKFSQWPQCRHPIEDADSLGTVGEECLYGECWFEFFISEGSIGFAHRCTGFDSVF